MKLQALTLFALLVGATLASPAQERRMTKPLVAVLDLQVTGGVLKSEAQALSDRLRSEMQSLQFDLIERSYMNALLAEQDFALSELSADNATKAGKLLSAEQIALGTIGKVGRTYTVDVRLIDVTTGKIVNSSKQDYDGPTDGLVQVMKNIARIFAGLEPEKIRLPGNTKWYLLSGAVAAGGGVAAYLLFIKKDNGIKAFSNPPTLP
jgi:TolB-like protein